MNDLSVKEPDQEAKIVRLPRDRVLSLTLIVGTALAFYVCYLLVLPFMSVLTWALALAVVAHPVHKWIARRIRHANLAAGLAVFLVTVTIIAPAVVVTERLVQEAISGVQTLKSKATADRWDDFLERNPRMARAVHWVERRIDVRGELQRALGLLTAPISSLVTGSIWVVTELLIILFVLFYFFRDCRLALRGLRSLVPLPNADIDQVFSRVADTIDATIYGTLVIAAMKGVLGGLIFWWLGLPAPLLWGVVMGVASIVPVLGPFVVWVPAAIYLAVQGSWGKAVILTAYGLLVLGLIDNLLYPMLVGKRIRIHTVPVFFSLLGGLALFGASGLILGPVTLAVTVALVEIWRRRTVSVQTTEMGVESRTNPDP
jgi:predicted PurR-regulated permease PerM